MTDRRAPALQGYLTSMVARLAGIDPGRLDESRPLTALGLDSLAMVELQAAVADELGVEIPVADLLEGITLRELAARLAGTAPAAVQPSPGPPEPEAAPPGPEVPPGVPALSPGQRALWVAHQLAPESAAYTLAAAARLPPGATAATAATAAPAAVWLPRALQALLDRHPALRTIFSTGPAGPQARVLERAELAWRLEDASRWERAELERRLGEEAFRPFSLEHGPMLRATLFTGPPEGDVLVVAVHHLAADFASFGVLARELGTLAAGGTLGPPPPSMTEAVHRQAAAWSGPRGDAAGDWWQQRLAGAPPLNLPTDRPRPPLQTFRGGARTALLPPALLADLARGRGRSHGSDRSQGRDGSDGPDGSQGPDGSHGRDRSQGRQATPFMAALAAFTALLARATGQEDFLVGVPLSLRSGGGLGRQEGRAGRFSGTVGYLVNPVALRADVTGEPTAGDLVDRARRATLDAFT
ncbi:MAG TPA: condensation domain-containing protein, partial [Thermoanaerobaculia bacterium]|nr:condensation domain-containing protein [Thermoanaerobaculia bacterium]